MAPIAPLPPIDLQLKLTHASAVEELKMLRLNLHQESGGPHCPCRGAKVAGSFCRAIGVCHHSLP